MANPIHRFNITDKDKRSQRKVADSTTELDKTVGVRGGGGDAARSASTPQIGMNCVTLVSVSINGPH